MNNKPVNIVCIKWGTSYGPEYVNRLYRAVKRNLSRPFRFVCVTDDKTGVIGDVETVDFPENPNVIGRSAWPNIFSKLCLFKPGFGNLEGPTLFLDVDLLVTGSLEKFFDYKPGEFCIIHNWIEARKKIFRRQPNIGNSSCFRFEAGSDEAANVYRIFLEKKGLPELVKAFSRGSQKFQTAAMLESGKVNWWPDSWVSSFKRHHIPLFPFNWIFTPSRPKPDVSVIAFHGKPDLPEAIDGYYRKNGKKVKPHLACRPAKWILEYWKD